MFQQILNFLFSLDKVTFSAGTRFSFGIEYPMWILPAALVLAVFGYWSYRRQTTTPTRRRILGILRAATLVSCLLLFCRPMLVLDREEKSRSVVAVWVDTSMSMTLEDPYKDPLMRDYIKLAMTGAATRPAGARINRFDVALAGLGKAKWIRDLTETQNVAIFAGSNGARLVGIAHTPEQVTELLGKLGKEQATGESTDLPMVVQDILQNTQGERVSSIVLMSDGQTTEKGSRIDQAVDLAKRTNVKIFALPLGQAEEPLDLKLASLQIPENAFSKDPVALRFSLSGTGIEKPTPVKVTVYRVMDGAETPMMSKEFTLEPSKKSLEGEMMIKPEKKGAEKRENVELVVRVEPVTAGMEELNLKNNVEKGSTVLLDAKMSVLYVEGYPRWEYRYLKTELIREKTIDVSTLLLSADENFAQEGDLPITRFPETEEELGKYDVLIIGDVEPAFFSTTQQKIIIDFVRKKGGGIAWIAGFQHNPESYKGTALEVLLPIVPDEIDPRARIMAASDNTAFNLTLTAAGKDSNLFRFFEDAETNLRQMTTLPEFYWFKPVQGSKPGSEVLAVHPTRTVAGQPLPMVVVGFYGEGRTLFSAVCDTWRWRRYNGEPLFQSYWLQMCRMLYQNKAMGQSKRIMMYADSARTEVGRSVHVSMDIKDQTLVAQIPSQVTVQVVDERGQPQESIVLNRLPGSQEKLEGIVTATTVGKFTLSIPAGTLPVDVAAYDLEITAPGREFERSTADIEGLTMVSVKTTGSLLPLYRGEELLKLIPDRSIPSLLSLSEELWSKPIALLLIVVLATWEWLYRKRAGLI